MKKSFCDHCGKELTGCGVNELAPEDCFWDSEEKDFVGYGRELCGDCWNERQKKHIELDKRFLHLSEKEEPGEGFGAATQREKRLAELAREILEKYQSAQTCRIYEYSGGIRRDLNALDKEVAEYMKEISEVGE